MKKKQPGFMSKLATSIVDAGLLPLILEMLIGFAPGLLAKILPPPEPAPTRPRPLLAILIVLAYSLFVFTTVFLVKLAIRWTPC